MIYIDDSENNDLLYTSLLELIYLIHPITLSPITLLLLIYLYPENYL